MDLLIINFNGTGNVIKAVVMNHLSIFKYSNCLETYKQIASRALNTSASTKFLFKQQKIASEIIIKAINGRQ